MTTRTFSTGLIRGLAALALGLVACSVEQDGTTDDEGCDGGKCDGFDEPDSAVRETPCDGKIVDESGRGLGRGKIAGRVNDALARFAFGEGDSCPTKFKATVQKLKDAGCTNHKTMFISETAQILEQATKYRAVTTLDCEVDGKASTVWFSAFGIEGSDGAIPQSVEMIAFDPIDGVFDYYESRGTRIDFFGTSEDFVADGAGGGAVRRCANCHTGGGLIMKELAAPWVHWEGDFPTPGTSDLIQANPDELGELSDGIELETLVRDGNDAWNSVRLENRIEELGNGASTADLLRPLFCTVELNLDSQFDDVRRANLGGAIVTGTLGFGALSFSNEQYQAVLEENNSRVEGLPEERRDTIGGLPFVSRGAADIDYQDKLGAAGIVDRDFIEDVLAIDFTRSIFSDDRCALLEFAPELSAREARDGKLKAKMIENLEAAAPAEGTPAADLLRNLTDEDDDASQAVQKFIDACLGRQDTREAAGQTVPGVLADYMTIISMNRKLAAQRPLFEFPETMPTDDLDVPAGTRLDPTTCQLVNEYVSVSLASAGGGDEGETGDGGGGDEAPGGGECCRTCVTSQACGNSCIGAEQTCNQEPGCACQG